MKLPVAIIAISVLSVGVGPDILAIRGAYASAASQRSGLKQLKKMLEAAPNHPVFLCYRGAAEMMEAKYAINPISKLTAFGKGKQLIENAIVLDSGNLECRFLRYGIQRNLPEILNYRKNLRNDSIVISRGLDTLNDIDLKKRIVNFMKHY